MSLSRAHRFGSQDLCGRGPLPSTLSLPVVTVTATAWFLATNLRRPCSFRVRPRPGAQLWSSLPCQGHWPVEETLDISRGQQCAFWIFLQHPIVCWVVQANRAEGEAELQCGLDNIFADRTGCIPLESSSLESKRPGPLSHHLPESPDESCAGQGFRAQRGLRLKRALRSLAPLPGVGWEQLGSASPCLPQTPLARVPDGASQAPLRRGGNAFVGRPPAPVIVPDT